MSAQACFLPVPQEGTIEFNPVLFNYQSRNNDPACLAILVCQEGTSATVLDNTTDRASWGQNLFHRNGTQKTKLKAARQSDFRKQQAVALGVKEEEVEIGDDADLVLILQIPLKQKPRPATRSGSKGMSAVYCCSSGLESASRGLTLDASLVDDVESAYISKGADLGTFNIYTGDAIERDTDLPIRITVQLYSATSNGVVSRETAADIVARIKQCYDRAEFVGSLVVGKQFRRDKDGKLSVRPTVNEHEDQPTSPPPGCYETVNPPDFGTKVVTGEEAVRLQPKGVVNRFASWLKGKNA
jgi:hypothetical protein